ncbi:MAG: phage major capsid protein [Phycisphaerales bacterium]|nr:MAG: phage major capsid protein [Phycisphaerales bacterium]
MAVKKRTITVDLSKTIDDLQDKRSKARDKADELVARVTTEDREFTPDEEKELKELQDQIVAYQKREDLLTKHLKSHEDADDEGVSRTQNRDVDPRRSAGESGRTEAEERESNYSAAFDKFLRHGLGSVTQEERSILQSRFSSLPNDIEARDLSAITGATGGFTVPTGFMAQVDKAMKDYSGVLKSNAQTITTDSGNDLPWPTVNDTSNEGELVGENTAVANADVSFGQITAKAYTFSSKLILVPIQLLQDTGVNVEALLSDLISERIGRILNRMLTIGTGANQPQGVVNGSTLGKTAAGATAITYDELVDLEHSVDPAYRTNAAFMLHDTTVGLLRKLKDSAGRPLWMPSMNAGMADGAPGLLNNRPYLVNQNMDLPTTGKKSVLFGDFSKYKIRRVRGMQILRLTERYAEKLQVGFFAYLRADGRLSNAGTNPIKHLIQA